MTHVASATGPGPATEVGPLLLLGSHLLLGLIATCLGATAFFPPWCFRGSLRHLSRHWVFHAWWLFPQLGHLAVLVSLTLWGVVHSSVGFDWLHTPHLAACPHCACSCLKRWHL